MLSTTSHTNRTKRIPMTAIAPTVPPAPLAPSVPPAPPAVPELTWREVRKNELFGYYKPTFSAEFISVLNEKLTNALIQRLTKKGDTLSIKMFNCIIMLTIFPLLIRKDGRVKGFQDESVVECVSELSYIFELEVDS